MRTNNYSPRRYSPYRYAQPMSSETFSMYNPEAEDRFIQAAAARQERFDTAVGSVAQTKALIAGMETADPQLLQNRLVDFEEQINKVVQDKYKGDYSAAAPELVSMIAQERSHPFYTFNAQKVKAVDQYNAMRQKLGANFLPTNNPADVSFDEWQQGADFGFTPINRNDIVANAQNVFQNLAKSLRGSALNRASTSPFIESVIKYGFQNEAEVRAFLQEPEGQAMVAQIYNSMPELAKLDQNVVMNAITQGAYSAIGQTKIDYMSNPDYLTAYQRGQLTTKLGNAGIPGSIRPAGEVAFDADKRKDYITNPIWRQESDQIAKDIAKEYGLDAKNTEELLDININSRDFEVLTGAKAAFGNLPIIGDLIDTKLSDLAKQQLIGKGLRRELKRRMDTKYGNIAKNKLFWEFSDLATSDPDAITKINKINKQVDDAFNENFTILKEANTIEGLNKTSKTNLKDIESDIKVADFNVDSEAGILLGITGKTADNESKASRVKLSDPGTAVEFINYISEVQPQFILPFLQYVESLREDHPSQYAGYQKMISLNQGTIFNYLRNTQEQ